MPSIPPSPAGEASPPPETAPLPAGLLLCRGGGGVEVELAKSFGLKKTPPFFCCRPRSTSGAAVRWQGLPTRPPHKGSSSGPRTAPQVSSVALPCLPPGTQGQTAIADGGAALPTPRGWAPPSRRAAVSSSPPREAAVSWAESSPAGKRLRWAGEQGSDWGGTAGRAIGRGVLRATALLVRACLRGVSRKYLECRRKQVWREAGLLESRQGLRQRPGIFAPPLLGEYWFGEGSGGGRCGRSPGNSPGGSLRHRPPLRWARKERNRKGRGCTGVTAQHLPQERSRR